MSRAGTKVKGEIAKAEIAPVLLVRILNIPEVLNPATKHSLYLTDCDYDVNSGSHTDIWWFDENNINKLYTSCGIKFESVQVTTDTQIETSTLSIDNVDRAFSSYAQYTTLNGVEVQIFRGFRELLGYPDGAQMLFTGHLKKVVISENALQAEVWADFSLKQRCPRRLYSVTDFPYIPASKDVRQVFRG